METNDAGIHTAGDDSDRGASASCRAALAAWLATPPTLKFFFAFTYAQVEEAFIAGWEAATGNQSVDGVHPREAREKA